MAGLAKAGFHESFEHMVVCSLRAELRGKPLCIEERRQSDNGGPFAFGIRISANLGISRCEDRMCLDLWGASVHAGQGPIRCLNGTVVAVEEIIRHPDVHSCPSTGAVEAKRSFEPGDGLNGFARKHQNGSALNVAFRIARIDLERPVDLA